MNPSEVGSALATPCKKQLDSGASKHASIDEALVMPARQILITEHAVSAVSILAILTTSFVPSVQASEGGNLIHRGGNDSPGGNLTGKS
jgi:hypothetical protein